VFYNFTFSPAKSVSIAALVGDDARIVEAHEHAVAAALSQLETFAGTRVRKHGQCCNRTTGRIAAAVFRHETSRALDPHLHSHCIVFNATFDPIEKQWKAIYTTNAIESLNRSLRKISKNCGVFPHEESLLKLYYLALERIAKKWTMPIHNWSTALNRFAIEFGDRMPRPN
jgi:conjugative relaxase-like TrwC/TraI family protein